MFFLLVAAVIFDQREQRIPNALILVGLILGLGFNIYSAGWQGLVFSLQGLVAGIALLFIPFALKGMGAGDVKLLGMVGAFKGALFAFQTFVAMALWGGLIAVILLIGSRQLGKTLKRMWTGLLLHLFKVQKLQETIETRNSGISFPYALAIALGAVSAYFIKW
jgi:prepilin peptidase CpaA